MQNYSFVLLLFLTGIWRMKETAGGKGKRISFYHLISPWILFVWFYFLAKSNKIIRMTVWLFVFFLFLVAIHFDTNRQINCLIDRQKQSEFKMKSVIIPLTATRWRKRRQNVFWWATKTAMILSSVTWGRCCWWCSSFSCFPKWIWFNLPHNLFSTATTTTTTLCVVFVFAFQWRAR